MSRPFRSPTTTLGHLSEPLDLDVGASGALSNLQLREGTLGSSQMTAKHSSAVTEILLMPLPERTLGGG